MGAFPLGVVDDFGLLDMSGNVLEWCGTEWQGDYKDYVKKENNKAEGNQRRVLRGGSFTTTIETTCVALFVTTTILTTSTTTLGFGFVFPPSYLCNLTI
ncbi:MAG: Formylglycine-generating sulfatase enzyme [Chloroflexi bacterium OLB14]|nr:MAG: Formylglycine-generating sulfatase enzyme [Chloroflexi bacterium OLB14]